MVRQPSETVLYREGLLTAGAGAFFHFLIAFVAAGVYCLASTRIRALRTAWAPCGLAYGVWVWAFMNLLVLPLTKVAPSPFNLAMTINGVVGHAVFVGLPIAYFARCVGSACPKTNA